MSNANATQDALGALLKEELRSRPLSKITVAGLTSAAGVSRQTFYYHFADVYELAVWVFERDIAHHIMAHASYSEWAQGFQQMLTYMKNNREQTYATINSLSHRELERFFMHQFQGMTAAIVAELEGDLQLEPESRTFVIDHYAMIVLGHLLHWFAGGMREEPADLVPRIELILRGSVRASLERFGAGSAVTHS
ncbi:TetR/AcrR family transcriptional regulator C-terminal domain-containing protein [Changpingibacter yushuensis]|uniref:TetR/AcrR family transcriptional regulator C-terminal domain-containing protein n=1 Tax=Changpingibacter yushuensis TaxID=2758440 RepID=UPI0015F6AECB|nr:TetR/AcrR family transcriptional regulator C-terminal domain-containing protein [Changpingibacter yushuensis]